ncbi:MAG: hypothetical protein O7E52_26310 [Candidatus Poribacteria bacterium]|nr:hypothetical protein [Candidatus Poribacteria bacterium]
MSQFTLEIPNEILQLLERLAQHQRKSLDQLILDQLKSMAIREVDPQMTQKRIEQAFIQSGLLSTSYQEKIPPPLSDAERENLAQKLAQAGSLSELILAEREERSNVDLLLRKQRSH